MNSTQRLYRSKSKKVIAGVAGGLGDYLNIDPVFIRIIFVLLVIFGGSGVLVYIILWIAIPSEDKFYFTLENDDQKKSDPAEEVNDMPAEKRSNSGMILGIILVSLGLLILAAQFLPMYNFWNFWPIALIIAGVLLIKPELVKSSK
jgi:phage shock protein PspC (stress-responsive transcriptional regulator)